MRKLAKYRIEIATKISFATPINNVNKLQSQFLHLFRCIKQIANEVSLFLPRHALAIRPRLAAEEYSTKPSKDAFVLAKAEL